MYICTMHNRIFIYALAVWVEPLALSLPASLILSCLCSAVSASRRALSLILMCASSLFSLFCNGFRALLKVFTCSLQAAKLLTIKYEYKTCAGVHN